MWPENVRTCNIWLGIQTQWRSGFGGREGLDYTAVLSYLQTIAGMRPKAIKQTFGVLQAMEIAAVNEFQKQAQKG